MPKINYRKLAFAAYDRSCAYCGFGIEAVLEVAHLDGDRTNNEKENLAILCPTCHKMHDIDLIPSEVITQMRDRPREIVWKKRMKDAGAKAALKRKRRLAALKAVATRNSRKPIQSLETRTTSGPVSA